MNRETRAQRREKALPASLDSRPSSLDSNWWEQDSNLRRHTPPALQSGPLGRLGIPPAAREAGKEERRGTAPRVTRSAATPRPPSRRHHQLAVGIEPTTFGLQNRCSAN